MNYLGLICVFCFFKNWSFPGVNFSFLFNFLSRFFSFADLNQSFFSRCFESSSELLEESLTSPDKSWQELKSDRASWISAMLTMMLLLKLAVLLPRMSAARESCGGDLLWRDKLCLLISVWSSGKSFLLNDGTELENTGVGSRGVAGISVCVEFGGLLRPSAFSVSWGRRGFSCCVGSALGRFELCSEAGEEPSSWEIRSGRCFPVDCAASAGFSRVSGTIPLQNSFFSRFEVWCSPQLCDLFWLGDPGLKNN